MYDLSYEQSLLIEEWRKTNTWRRIAEKAYEKWPYKDIIPGNQLEGIELCNEASIILGRNILDYCVK